MPYTLTLPTSDNYTSNLLNQYSVVPDYTPPPEYDLDGNLTRGPVPGANGNIGGIQAPVDATEITWDAEQSDRIGRILDGGEAVARRVSHAMHRMMNQNRLISCKIGTVTYDYGYDHLSRQVLRGQTSAITRHYFYDGWNRIAEYSSTPTSPVLNTFTWGLDLSGSLQGAGGVGGLLATRWAGEVGQPDYFPTYDGNGNVTEYLTTSGAVEVHYEYDPFGGLTRLTGNPATRFRYRFSTKLFDLSTGLYYYGYRWYDPLTGRWPSRDPIEERGGVNLYGFVTNNPIIKADKLGLVDMNLSVTTPGGPAHREVDTDAHYYDKWDPGNGTYDVVGHGETTYMSNAQGQVLEPKDLAALIMADPNYKSNPRMVVLYSCSTGELGDGFARQLSNILCQDVRAPNNGIKPRITESAFSSISIKWIFPYLGDCYDFEKPKDCECK